MGWGRVPPAPRHLSEPRTGPSRAGWAAAGRGARRPSVAILFAGLSAQERGWRVFLKNSREGFRENSPREKENSRDKRFPVIPHHHHSARYWRTPFLSVTIPVVTARSQRHKSAIRERGLLHSFPRAAHQPPSGPNLVFVAARG